MAGYSQIDREKAAGILVEGRIARKSTRELEKDQQKYVKP